jgi:hypothetical protein
MISFDYLYGFNTSSSHSPAAGPNLSHEEQYPVFTVHKLAGTRIRMCYGCNSAIRTDTINVPPPRHDLVVHFKERRYYHNPESHALKLTQKEENTYYHFMRECILMKHASFVSTMLNIPMDIGQCLTASHTHHLYDSFGLVFP